MFPANVADFTNQILFYNSRYVWRLPMREGSMGGLLQQSPNFPIRWLNNFGDFSDFRLVGSFTLVLKRFNHWFLSTVKVILRIIIGNVHPFIGHCLIPLDSLETTTCSWLELWLPSLVKSLSADECIFYKFQWSDSA